MQSKQASHHRMPRNPKRPQNKIFKQAPLFNDRPNKPLISLSIRSQQFTRLLDGSIKNRRAPIVKRMRQRNSRINPLKPVFAQWQRSQKRRSNRHRMHRRTHIVRESRQRQLLRTHPPANSLLGFKHQNRSPRARQYNSRGQSVRARADDNAIVFASVPQSAAYLMTNSPFVGVPMGVLDFPEASLHAVVGEFQLSLSRVIPNAEQIIHRAVQRWGRPDSLAALARIQLEPSPQRASRPR